jgi:hypothetical protein
VADVSGSNGFEADNDANGSGNSPKSKATFSNITVVGPSGTVNSNYKRAAHLRRNTENAIFNSVLVGSYPVGLFIDGDSCANNATNGKLIVRNSFFTGMTTPLSTNAANGFNITNWAADKAIVASNNAADAKLVDPFNINLPNPRPQPGSPVLTAASFNSDARIQDNFFTPVSYAGAFGPASLVDTTHSAITFHSRRSGRRPVTSGQANTTSIRTCQVVSKLSLRFAASRMTKEECSPPMAWACAEHNHYTHASASLRRSEQAAQLALSRACFLQT